MTKYTSQKLTSKITLIDTVSGGKIGCADFYLGSGTTAEVCKDLNRNFVGCDINQRAVELSKKRCGVFS